MANSRPIASANRGSTLDDLGLNGKTLSNASFQENDDGFSGNPKLFTADDRDLEEEFVGSLFEVPKRRA